MSRQQIGPDRAADSVPTVRISVLGPLAIQVDGVPESVGPPLRQAVLACLSAQAGTVVSKEQLMDAVWGERLPGNASGNIHTYIARLRKQLEPGHRQRAVDGVLATVHGGYCLRLPPAHLDSTRFLTLRARARAERAPAPEAAAGMLREALAMWRGTPLHGVPGPFAAAERQRLQGLRLATLEEYGELLLDLDRPDIVVQELSPVTRDHPLRESAHLLLMRALERGGHRDEALEVYERVREGLDEELGVRPGAALIEARDRLRGGTVRPDGNGPPDGRRAIGRAAGPAAPAVQPRRYPPPRPGRFVGRQRALDELASALGPGDRPRVCVVTGGAGTGKTTLALEWAHRVADTFPDGCLYAELRGFSFSDPPPTAAETLYDFLVALGVTFDQIPRTVSARAALFRSLTEQRRLLVLLDDARTGDDVLPMLPAGRGCATLVTSRRRLDTLVVRHAAQPLLLGPMDHRDARALLDMCAGPERTEAEPEEADALVEYCVRLPLAISMVGNRALSSPQLPLQELLTRIRRYGSRLDALSSAQPETGADLRTVFRASAAELSAPARRAFCLLSLFPGTHVDPAAAGALLDRTPREAAALLSELVSDNLLATAGPERYRFHDLLREFAGELAEELLDARESAAARERLLRWTLHAAREASRLIEPRALHDRFPVRPTPWSVGGPTDRSGAVRWLAVHQHDLVATAELAYRLGRYDVAWRLPAILTAWFYLRKNWALWLRLLRTGARAARRAGATAGLAQIRAGAGLAHLDLGHYRQARRQLTRAAAEFQRLDDQWQLGTVLVPLGDLYLRTHRFDQALHTFESARRCYQRAGDEWGAAWALSALGRALLATGHPGRAVAALERALRVWRTAGYTRGEADSMMQLGQAHLAADRPREARRFLSRADRMYESLGDTYRHAQALVWLGRLYRQYGDLSSAREAWRTALSVFEALGAPDAAECGRLLEEG
ncbi:AfsR/SARP family transcriptional regulator [Streptomyces montanisoli]|uniref:Tetratricopeptide repeat protein n=1 Tax=Streptomyces montanisoli TaxID=2798581 RepID=A0A940M949_9ACTN|nr:BTAD domain-containing putative transcriptional regulator [Streptomyces montanisoli]MBP0456602.1 tetratricopeptide repeat protein [Streptomyces montanisoli]